MNTFKKIAAAMAVALGTVALIGGAANAQGKADVVKPFTIKIGGEFFTDSDVKKFTKNAPSLGLVYDFGKTKATNPLVYSAYLDGLYKKTHGVKLSIFGIGAQGRYLLAPADSKSGVPYLGAGVGVYFLKADPGQSKTRVGGKLLAGYELTNGLLGELEYNIIGEVEGTSFNTFGVRLGYRF